MTLKFPVIILASPQLGENIGSAARLMSNFGFCELRIVTPRDGWPNAKAIELSANAIDIINTAKIFPSVNKAIADITLLFATSCQRRDLAKPALELEDTAKICIRKLPTEKIGFLFGRERSGLSNDELILADFITTIPTYTVNTSLNLAQAVGLVCYELYKTYAKKRPPDKILSKKRTNTLATKTETEFFFNTLESQLKIKGFFKNEKMEPVMRRNIRNMFLKAQLTDQDLRTLHGILTALKG